MKVKKLVVNQEAVRVIGMAISVIVKATKVHQAMGHHQAEAVVLVAAQGILGMGVTVVQVVVVDHTLPHTGHHRMFILHQVVPALTITHPIVPIHIHRQQMVMYHHHIQAHIHHLLLIAILTQHHTAHQKHHLMAHHDKRKQHILIENCSI